MSDYNRSNEYLKVAFILIALLVLALIERILP